MTTLADFVLARLDEDESVARAPHHSVRDERVTDMDRIEYDSEYGYARLGIGRVLADCHAKRTIVERATSHRTIHDDHPWHGMAGGHGWFRLTDKHGHTIAEGDEADRIITEHSDPVTDTPELRILAAVYSDHPDYQAGWAP